MTEIRDLQTRQIKMTIFSKWPSVITSVQNIDIAVVTESWFSPNSIDYSNIHGNCMYSKSREIRKGGGVAVFVNNGIPSKTLNIQIPD